MYCKPTRTLVYKRRSNFIFFWVIYIPVLLYLNLFWYIFEFVLIYIHFLNVTKRCIQSHLLTRLVTVCLIRCVTKYYKRPHKKKSCSNWMINGHTKYTFLHFKQHMVTLINIFCHFMLNCMWLNIQNKDALCD